MIPTVRPGTDASGPQLGRWGVRAGLELVRSLMRELGLVACQPRPWRPSTRQHGEAGPIPDLVNGTSPPLLGQVPQR